MLTITGTVGASGKYDITSIPLKTTTNTVLKITFENNTSALTFNFAQEIPHW